MAQLGKYNRNHSMLRMFFYFPHEYGRLERLRFLLGKYTWKNRKRCAPKACVLYISVEHRACYADIRLKALLSAFQASASCRKIESGSLPRTRANDALVIASRVSSNFPISVW